MKHSFALMIIVRSLIAVAEAQGTDQERSVLQAERDLAMAYQRSDADGIARGVMEEYRLTNSRGKVTTRSDDLEEAKKIDPKYDIFENHNMDVRVHGDTAVVIGITHAKGISGGVPFDAEFQFTDTFVNDHGRWRLFAGHVTRLMAENSK